MGRLQDGGRNTATSTRLPSLHGRTWWFLCLAKTMRCACLLCFVVLGCSTIGALDKPECAHLRFEERAWNATALTGAALSGVSSAGAPIADEWAPDEARGDWQLGLGITGAIGGALSILGTSMGTLVRDDAVEAECMEVPSP